MDPSQQSGVEHLCVLVHGLWGNPSHLKYLEQSLQEQHAGPGLHILIPKSNQDNYTYDGIEVGGERITNEIEQTIKELEHGGAKIKKISVTGYSLGGLVARYAIGLMYKSGMFQNIEPTNFTTFATPHLGVRAPKRGFGTSIWNRLGGRTLSTSGQQMFLIDEFRKSGRPLLSILADEASIFMKGLASFKNKSLYANVINDRSVPYYTAGISRTDPFVDLEQVDLHYIDGQQDPAILDPRYPVSKRKARRASELMKLSLYQRYALSPETRKSIPFYALFFTLMPIAIPTFLINSAIQTYRSAQRVKLHETGQAGISLGRYRIPLLEERIQHARDHAFERVATNQSAEYLPTPPPESSSPRSSSSEDESKPALALRRTQSNRDAAGFPILALTEDQFRMIDNLDEVGFQKFPVHISKHRHTHAAIVVRTEKAGFEQGRAVVGHWVGRFEV